MEITEENMTQREVLEKMTELEYSLHHQRNLNAEMRLWLDIADDDIAQLRSENAALKKKVKDQAMTISVAQQVKTEPCRTFLANDLDVKRITDNNIKRLLKSLQLERDLDKISLNASKVAAQAFEELQLTNQELKKQLEEAQDEAIFNALNDRMEKEEGLLSSPLSFAEEMKLLASSLEVETSMSDAIYVRHVETNDQELLKHESFTIDLQKKWCAGSHGVISLSKRELIQKKEDTNQNDTRSAISEFPEDIFTLEQRRQGAVLLHVLCAIYMFHALAIVCDVYFVPSLEKVSENLHLSQDVAGATFMAAGSSAPELFTSLIGVFITKGDVGVGTIVGSAVFNILVIIGICGIFAGRPITLSWWPLFRDAVFYILSIVVLILVIYDEKVLWWETIIMISMYGIYIIIMKFNQPLCSLVERHCSRAGQPCLGSLRRTTAVGNAGDCDNDMVPLKPGAGARSCTCRQMLIRARVGPEEGGASGEEGLGASGPWERENGTVAEGERQMLAGERERDKEVGGQTDGGAQPKEEEEEEDGQEEAQEENAPFKPFVLPVGWCVRLKWLLSWPVSVLLHYTIPKCNLPQWERWYLLTFLSSTLWIAVFSYLMVWMVTIISYTLGIPDVLMGMGDMAVSNSIGSNIFDVLLGLGFPWALRTLIVSYGSVVTINSKGLVYSVILLLASVILTVLCVHLNHWRLDRRLGLCLMLLYAIFLLCSIGFERL
ncbi:Sodium/potassium/calcium exchanger 3 [Channa argus]|uniref:Sodium/potassium/calcium exchanger 3 n=1 Tax=Channa argus TaxID=215402 RepID=A0A6G1PVG7_CHAAH|nr:Sodium/potassium/calcium exchanger 3 [Channa argus]